MTSRMTEEKMWKGIAKIKGWFLGKSYSEHKTQSYSALKQRVQKLAGFDWFCNAPMLNSDYEIKNMF